MPKGRAICGHFHLPLVAPGRMPPLSQRQTLADPRRHRWQQVRLLAILNDFSLTVHIAGVAAVVLALFFLATKQPRRSCLKR